MQTQYGKLPIVVDPTTGRAKMVRGGPVATKAVSLNTGSTRAGIRAPLNQSPSPIDVYDSKLEAARATYLGYLQLAKDLKRVVHHPFSIQLAPTLWYTPDYLIEWNDGRIQVEEVKGNLKQKNARDSLSRLKVAAAKLPMFDWRLTMRIRGQWEERCIPSST